MCLWALSQRGSDSGSVSMKNVCRGRQRGIWVLQELFSIFRVQSAACHTLRCFHTYPHTQIPASPHWPPVLSLCLVLQLHELTDERLTDHWLVQAFWIYIMGKDLLEIRLSFSFSVILLLYHFHYWVKTPGSSATGAAQFLHSQPLYSLSVSLCLSAQHHSLQVHVAYSKPRLFSQSL